MNSADQGQISHSNYVLSFSINPVGNEPLSRLFYELYRS